jgi:hypothetical protein
MAIENNPSIVSDESGNNYGGIGNIGGMQEAQQAYLENLSNLAQHAVGSPMTQNQYFPNATEGIQAGTISSRTLGSVPIFATGSGLLPFGMLDEMEKAKYEAEAKFYKDLKEDLDKPLFADKLQLADPFKQPAFANKVQDIIDQYLNMYTQRLGDPMKAYLATKHDKNFQKTMRTCKEYVDMFKVVFAQAAQIEADINPKDGNIEKYVDPEVIKSVDDFLYSHSNLDSLTPDTLLKNAQKFKSVMSADKLAEAATAGYKDSVIDSDFKNYGSMSTDELDVYIKTKTTNEGAADDIIKTALESSTYSWLKNKPDQLAIFERGVRNRIKFDKEKAIQTVKKNNADRDLGLRKMGWMDEKGDITFQDKPSIMTGTIAKNALDYPIDKNNPIPTVGGMSIYIRDPKGQGIRRVTVPNSYSMIPTSEYDIIDEGGAVKRGRYIEGKIHFQATEPYTPDITKTINKMPIAIGEGRTVQEIKPVDAVDDAGNVVQLFGETTVLTPYEIMKGQIEANIPYASYAHEQLNKVTYPSGGRRNFDPNRNATSDVIIPPDDATIDFFKDDPNIFYRWGTKVLSGAYIHKNAGQ